MNGTGGRFNRRDTGRGRAVHVRLNADALVQVSEYARQTPT